MNIKRPISPAGFIDSAKETVDQRGTENGYDVGKERSAAKVAKVFNALTDHNLTESDVWTLLIVLKQVRNQRQFKVDNIIDMIGYTSLLGECLDASSQANQEGVFKVTGHLLDELAQIPVAPGGSLAAAWRQ